MRRTHGVERFAVRSDGNTSAYAEKTERFQLRQLHMRKHLRLRGENSPLTVFMPAVAEIPPRMRRKLFFKRNGNALHGNTSEYAEKTPMKARFLPPPEKHLRESGENTSRLFAT